MENIVSRIRLPRVGVRGKLWCYLELRDDEAIFLSYKSLGIEMISIEAVTELR